MADDDDGQVVAVCDGQAGGATRVKAPFEDVAFDDEGAGDLAGGVALGGWPDVDEDGAGLLRGVGLVWFEPAAWLLWSPVGSGPVGRGDL